MPRSKDLVDSRRRSSPHQDDAGAFRRLAGKLCSLSIDNFNGECTRIFDAHVVRAEVPPDEWEENLVVELALSPPVGSGRADPSSPP
jgi:hypothetical protein